MQTGLDILIVEDSATQAAHLREILRLRGYSTDVASDGRQALEALRRHRTDLIISDVRMPVMDGFQLCRAVKADPDLHHIPVILLTSLSSVQDVLLALEAGADFHIPKPYDGDYLLKKLSAILKTSDDDARGESTPETVTFEGTTYHISASREQILSLLLSTYEVAIQQNNELQLAREALEAQNASLEQKVRERTASLTAEIADRERAEGTLRLHSAALNAAAAAIIITDCTGTIEWTNAAFGTLTGYTAEETIGKNPRQLVKSGVHAQEFYRDLWDTILAGRMWRGEMTNRRKDGSVYPEQQTITPVKNADGGIAHFVAIKGDLTERRRLEAEFLQAQKMETVGRLAGGISHDFNNLLTVINGTVELALLETGEGNPLRESLDEIRDAGQRAALLTRQLLAFSSKQTMKLEAVNLGALATGVQSMVQRLIGENIVLTVVSGGGAVMADRTQIEQVLMNLAVNARDAMPNGGALTITVRDMELDAASVPPDSPVKPGPHVMLTISDTGTGMDETTRARIFEPFFTTKAPGRGTGLGLSTVYGIVRQSHGGISVSTAPGKGTTFAVYFPRVASVATDVQVCAAPRAIQRGTETILLVEDEEAVRRLTQRILGRAGYVVLPAGDGQEARRMLEQHDRPVDLLITDVIMPGINGWNLAAELKTIQPQLKVIYVSGYTGETVLPKGLTGSAANFVGKPYTASQLTKKVRDVLDE